MKRLFFALLMLAATVAQAQPLCTVRGTIYDQFGAPVVKPQITVSGTQLVSGQYIISRNSKTHTGDAQGRIEFTVFRNAVVHLKSNTVDSLYYGQLVYIPDADSVQLTSLPIGTTTIPPRYVVAIASGSGVIVESGGVLVTDEATTLNFSSHFSTIETPTGTVNININAYRDSVQHKLDSINTVLYNLSVTVAGKQAQLSAAQVARMDTVLIPGVRVTFIVEGNNVRIEVDTTGFFALYGGVMAEADPTIAARLDSALTQGERSLNTSGRYTVATDSITFTAGVKDVIDCKLGNVFRGTLTHSDTLFFANIPTDVSQTINVRITNAGAYTLTFWNDVGWSGGTAPTITATANKRTWLTFIIAGGIVDGVSVPNFP